MFFADNSTKIECNTQSFSSTDYSRNPNDLGVVFPYGNEQEELNTINVSSIIDHHHEQVTLIKHTESCLVDKYKNDDIKYTKVVNTIGIYIKEQKETLLDLLGKQESHQYIYEYDKPITLDSELFKQRLEIYKEQPTVSAIEESNVKKKVYPTMNTHLGNSQWNQWLKPEASPIDFITDDTYSYIKYKLNTYKTATERLALYKELEDNIDYIKLKTDPKLPYALRQLMNNLTKDAFVRKLVFEVDTETALYYDTNCRKLPKDIFEYSIEVPSEDENLIQDIPIEDMPVLEDYEPIIIQFNGMELPIDEVVNSEVLDYLLTAFDMANTHEDLDIIASDIKFDMSSKISETYGITNSYALSTQIVDSMLNLYRTVPNLEYFEEFEMPLEILIHEFVELCNGKK